METMQTHPLFKEEHLFVTTPYHSTHVLKMSASTSASKEDVGDAAKLIGECRYCGKAILQKERLLPLECLECKNLFHVRCLRGAKPPVFLGDNLYRFTCAFCGSLGKETWERPNLQWYTQLCGRGRGG